MPGPSLQQVPDTGRDWQSGFREMRERMYKAGTGMTLVRAGLEEGNYLPDDNTFEIIEASIERHKGARVIRVVAMKEAVE